MISQRIAAPDDQRQGDRECRLKDRVDRLAVVVVVAQVAVQEQPQEVLVLHDERPVEQQPMRDKGDCLWRCRAPGQRARDVGPSRADEEDEEDDDRHQPQHEEAEDDPADEKAGHGLSS